MVRHFNIEIFIEKLIKKFYSTLKIWTVHSNFLVYIEFALN